MVLHLQVLFDCEEWGEGFVLVVLHVTVGCSVHVSIFVTEQVLAVEEIWDLISRFILVLLVLSILEEIEHCSIRILAELSQIDDPWSINKLGQL